MMSYMVGRLLLLQGSISNLTCHIDFDSTQLDLDTWSCRYVHRNCQNLIKETNISTIVLTLVLERWQMIPYKNKTKLWNVQNVGNTIMKDQKAQSIFVRSKVRNRQNIFYSVCKPQSYLTDIYVLPIGVFNLRQHFEISYSKYANKHYITGVYITINDSCR